MANAVCTNLHEQHKPHSLDSPNFVSNTNTTGNNYRIWCYLYEEKRAVQGAEEPGRGRVGGEDALLYQEAVDHWCHLLTRQLTSPGL